jgi:hypothetical protein
VSGEEGVGELQGGVGSGRVNWSRGGSGRGAPRRAGGGGGRRLPVVALRPELMAVVGLVSTSRSWGSLLGGQWGQWVVDGGYPRRPVAHRRGGAGGGGDWGSRVGDTVKEPGEWVAGALVVLTRAKDKALWFCSELSMAAARWWPAVARVIVARAKEDNRGETGPGQGESDAWRPPKQEVGRQRRRGGALHRRQ